MEARGFVLHALANGLGTLFAAAVIYLVGVAAGAITFHLGLTVLSSALGLGLGIYLAGEAGRRLDNLDRKRSRD